MCTCLVFVLQKCHECFVWSMIIMIHRKNPKPSQAHPERRKQVWTEQTAGGPTKQDFKLSETIYYSAAWTDSTIHSKAWGKRPLLLLGLAFGAIDARKRCRRAEPWATKAVSAFTSSDCIQMFAWKKTARISPSAASSEICRSSERQQCQEPSARENFLGFHISSKTFKSNSTWVHSTCSFKSRKTAENLCLFVTLNGLK